MLRREQSEQFRNLARQYCESAPGNEWPTLASAHLQDMAPHDGDGARCTFFAKDALEGWIHRLKVEKRLVDIEDDQGKSGHIAGLLSFASDLEFLGWSAPVLEPAAVRGGACTVFLDGKPLRSCSFPVSALGDREVTTIEGMSGREAAAVQRAWVARDVPQCGYCQSGQVMSAVALLKEVKRPTDRDIDLAMNGNLCRCATYVRIRAAIKDAARSLGA